MSEDKFQAALNEAKLEYIKELPKLISLLRKNITAINGQKVSGIDFRSFADTVRELHNIKSVAGSYGLDFIVSAIRNLLDHTAYIYDLEVNVTVDLSLSFKILDLLDDYTISLKKSEDASLLSQKLDSLNTQKRVLLVEKDERLIEHLKKIFEEKQLKYSIVTNGHEALGRLLDERFDLLITDLHVGSLDGPSLIASTRVSNCQNRNIKSLMLSVSYFDLLPSISMPDFFISKNENILTELSKALDKFLSADEIKSEQKINILSLDDDKNIHDLLKISFKDHNIHYQASLTGDDFIQKFSELKPDIILLDLILENESGVEVIKRLKKKITSLDVPVIVLTSLDGQLKSELMSEIPFIVGSLSKPFTPKSMASQIMSIFKHNKMSY